MSVDGFVNLKIKTNDGFSSLLTFQIFAVCFPGSQVPYFIVVSMNGVFKANVVNNLTFELSDIDVGRTSGLGALDIDMTTQSVYLSDLGRDLILRANMTGGGNQVVSALSINTIHFTANNHLPSVVLRQVYVRHILGITAN